MSCASVQEQAPRANRLHIGIFGCRNAGKSSLLNAMTEQNIALVSEIPGSTADPVYKAMELHPLGPVVFIDTAGLDDTEDDLGKLRIKKSEEVFEKVDLALLLIPAGTIDIDQELTWHTRLKKNEVIVLVVLSHIDKLSDKELAKEIAHYTKLFRQEIFPLSNTKKKGLAQIRDALCTQAQGLEEPLIVAHLLPVEALVLLVMPQDKQAPKGRLILPQVQVLRELLDHKCQAVCTTTDNLDLALKRLNAKPDLVIVDSQVFHAVNQQLPKEQALTSFSILMAGKKGEFHYYMEGTQAIDSLQETDRVLVIEACTHKALKNDIGREQIPHALRKKIGPGLRIDIHVGGDLPANIRDYHLIVQCASCMMTRRQNINRLHHLQTLQIPVTNYGLTLAKINGMLDRVSTPLNMKHYVK